MRVNPTIDGGRINFLWETGEASGKFISDKSSLREIEPKPVGTDVEEKNLFTTRSS